MRITFSLLTLLFVSNFSFGQFGFKASDSIVCPGDCIFFTDTSTVVYTDHLWQFTGAQTTTDGGVTAGPICYDTPGTYTVTVTATGPDGQQAVAQQSIYIGTPPDTLTVISDTSIEMGGAAIVNGEGEGGVEWQWLPADLFDCDTCPDAVMTPFVTTYAVCEYYSTDGCALRDSVLVTVNYRDVIAVPNSFSPDDNGVNDKVFVKGPGITNMVFRIYDRYGILMFRTTFQDEGWDGTFEGRELNPATFFWTLDYTLIDSTTNTKSGTITLIK